MCDATSTDNQIEALTELRIALQKAFNAKVDGDGRRGGVGSPRPKVHVSAGDLPPPAETPRVGLPLPSRFARFFFHRDLALRLALRDRAKSFVCATSTLRPKIV